MQNKQVPVLITWDVDPDQWATYDRRQRALSRAIDLCEEFDIRSRFFITANFAHEYPAHIERMQALDQEIGCHGLTHTDEEDYDRMPEAMQWAYIEEATSKLEAAIGGPVQAFRSPRVKISATTLRLLAEHGYLSDSSVCSQRFDLVSSNLVNKGWLLAPRRPYHPHHINPFKRGELSIWEVPVSALVVPFTSKILNVLGLPSTKILFRLLYAESRRTGKPIVYLSHPTELIPSTGKGRSPSRLFEPRFFSPQPHPNSWLPHSESVAQDGRKDLVQLLSRTVCLYGVSPQRQIYDHERVYHPSSARGILIAVRRRQL